MVDIQRYYIFFNRMDEMNKQINIKFINQV